MPPVHIHTCVEVPAAKLPCGKRKPWGAVPQAPTTASLLLDQVDSNRSEGQAGCDLLAVDYSFLYSLETLSNSP